MPQTTEQWRAEATEIELRERATEMRKEWAELRKLDRESDDYSKGKTQFKDEMEDIDTQLDLRQMATPSPRRKAPAGALDGPESETRSPGQQLVEHEGFRNWMRENAGRDHIEGPSPRVEMRDLVTLGASTNLTLPVQQPGLIGVRRRRLFLRDLLSVVGVTQAAVPYIRELNAVANESAATTVPEGGTKPEAKIEFTTDLAVVTVVAVNIPITTQMLEDSTFIEGYINTRLGYMVQVEEEDQLLNGDGLGSNLKGLTAITGTQTQAAIAGETAQTIAGALMKLELVDAEADAVVMNPANAWPMWTKRAAGGAGTFDSGTPFANVPMNVWGLPVVRTRAVAAGTAWVGSWAMGGTVLDRRSAFVRGYEQHSDFVIKNKVLIQCEERVGVMYTNPDFFVKVTIA